MNSSIYRFILDLHSTQSQISIPVTLGDTAREFHISFSDGGVPYIIEDGCLVKLEIKRPTGTHLEEFCAIERNTTIKYDFSQNENTAAVEGVHVCSVILYDAEGKQISAPRFSMIVSSRVLNSDDIVIGDVDNGTVDAIIKEEAKRQAAETSRVNAENSRVSAENARANAEIQRVNTLRKIEEALFAGELNPTYSSVTLRASDWVGTDDPYSQVVSIPGVAENSRVDLLPTVEQLAVFHDKDITLVTENVGGVVTVYCIGDKPTKDYDIEICITEVKI